MAYKLKTGSRGKLKVAFNCERCGADLESPLEEAGERFPCPTCAHELIVPGAEDLQRLRAEEAVQCEQKLRDDAARAAASREREEERKREELARKQQKAEEERQRAAERAARAQSKTRGVSWAAFSCSLVVLACCVVLIVYFSMMLPLRSRLDQLGRDVAALSDTVNHNAKAAQTTAADLAALTTTVNHNADVANRRTAELTSELLEVGRLARNANSHAHSHPGF